MTGESIGKDKGVDRNRKGGEEENRRQEKDKKGGVEEEGRRIQWMRREK